MTCSDLTAFPSLYLHVAGLIVSLLVFIRITCTHGLGQSGMVLRSGTMHYHMCSQSQPTVLLLLLLFYLQSDQGNRSRLITIQFKWNREVRVQLQWWTGQIEM